MLKRLGLIVSLLLLSSYSFAVPIGASPGGPVTPFNALDLASPLGISQDYSLVVGTNGTSVITWQTIFSAAPASITTTLEGSTNCSNYSTIDTSINVNGEIRTVYGSYTCVRVNNSAVGTGAGKTLTLRILYTTGRAIGNLSGGSVYSGGNFTGPIILPDGDAANPSLRWASGSPDGFFYSSTVNGTSNVGITYRNADAQSFAIGFSGSDRSSTLVFNSYIGTNSYFQVNANNGTGFASCEGNGTLCLTFNNRGIQSSRPKTITDAAAAVPVWRCAIPSNDYLGVEVDWTAESTDTTDYRVTKGRHRFAGVNKGGTVTCAAPNTVGTDLTASSNANTLVCTWTSVVNTTNCDLSVTCTDNTVGTQTMSINSLHYLTSPNPTSGASTTCNLQ